MAGYNQMALLPLICHWPATCDTDITLEIPLSLMQQPEGLLRIVAQSA